MSNGKFFRKLRIVLTVIALVILVALAGIFYYLRLYHENIDKPLPLSISMESPVTEETAASQLFETYLQPYRNLTSNPWVRITSFQFNKVQVLAGTPTDFAAGVTFSVTLAKGRWSALHSWGTVQSNGEIQNVHWTLRIKKTKSNQYTLEQIDTTEAAIAGLPPVKDEYQKKAGIPVQNTVDSYQIKDNQLQVTYDSGSHWTSVPVEVKNLFQGDYSGPKDELIAGSYIVAAKRTAFVVYDGNEIRIVQSLDKGKTWTRNDIGSFTALRLRFLGFTSKKDGYLVVSGDRTMSQEGTCVYLTTDGGQTWKGTGGVSQTSSLLTAGGFVNSRLGFMSFGSTGTPAHPALYRTDDGGKTWIPVNVSIPAQYQGVFVEARIPTFDGQQGTLLVDQGPEGDYEGGKVMARFISLDGGKTWHFANLVDPDNVLSK